MVISILSTWIPVKDTFSHLLALVASLVVIIDLSIQSADLVPKVSVTYLQIWTLSCLLFVVINVIR